MPTVQAATWELEQSGRSLGARLESEGRALQEAEDARRHAESAARAAAAETEHLAVKVLRVFVQFICGCDTYGQQVPCQMVRTICPRR